MKKVDLTGMVFGRLTVLHPAPDKIDKKGRTVRMWWCRCQCGTEKSVSYSNLKGKTKSCGCIRSEACSKRTRKPTQFVITNQIFTYYKRNAKIRKIEWDLDRELFEKMILSPCHYCGIVGGTITKGPRIGTQGDRTMANNGIDRIDNNLGYTKDNSVPCCKFCNLAKNNLSVEEFMAAIQRVHEHQMLTTSFC